MNTVNLTQLLKRQDLWQGLSNFVSDVPHVKSGFSQIDSQLHFGGWPLGQSIELLCNGLHIGELPLLIPALAQLSSQQRWIAFINPPILPYAPALQAAGIDPSRILIIRTRGSKDILWATEQALSTGTCSAVISWMHNCTANNTDLRRIQLAANQSDCLHIQIAGNERAQQASPASLRICLDATEHGTHLNVIKQRGAAAGQTFEVAMFEELREEEQSPQQWPLFEDHFEEAVNDQMIDDSFINAPEQSTANALH